MFGQGIPNCSIGGCRGSWLSTHQAPSRTSAGRAGRVAYNLGRTCVRRISKLKLESIETLPMFSLRGHVRRSLAAGGRTHARPKLSTLGRTLASQWSLRPVRCNFPMALKMKKSPATPLERTLTRKCVAKSFGIHSYKFKGLKLPCNDTLTKNTGGVDSPPFVKAWRKAGTLPERLPSAVF